MALFLARSLARSPTPQWLLITAWIVFRSGTDLYVWYLVLSDLPSWVGGPVLAMVYVTCGHILLSVYLNPFWLLRKVVQVHRPPVALLCPLPCVPPSLFCRPVGGRCRSSYCCHVQLNVRNRRVNGPQ